MRLEDRTPNLLAYQPFARVHETHSGVVLLYGDRAYKTKKPIVTDFLDFSTAERRDRACRRELELNRRLAPEIYLGVARFTPPDDCPEEPVLVMRRMPEERRLSALLTTGALGPGELRALAATLADFHRGAARGPEIDREGTAEALRLRWRILLHSLADQPPGALDPDLVARADRLAMRFLDGRAPLFAQRIAARRVVDGHGDLLAEDIFALPDGFAILDCLDFDDALRAVDVLDDVAFLAMDIEYLGRGDLAAGFLDAYLRATGDTPPPSLRHHYIAYRALVRAKTDRIRAGQGDPEAPEHARRHLELAVAHLERGAVRVALIGGLPGTGKSTVARALATRTGATVVSSDTVRAELRAAGTITGEGGEYGTGAYRPAARALVYDRMLARARTELELGRSVILDASWTDPEYRSRAIELADHSHSDLLAFRCECPPSVAAAHLRDRPHGDSEATPEIAAAMAATAADWPGAVQLDTAAALDDTVATATRTWELP